MVIKIVRKDWGQEDWIADTKEYLGKILTINGLKYTSLHWHRKKKETLYVLSGEIEIHFWRFNQGKLEWVKMVALGSGDAQTIPKRTLHKTFAKQDSKIIEVSTPHPQDVERFEDLNWVVLVERGELRKAVEKPQ